MCGAFGITMSQFFLEGGETDALPEEQRELLHRWTTLSKEQKELVLALMRNMRCLLYTSRPSSPTTLSQRPP